MNDVSGPQEGSSDIANFRFPGTAALIFGLLSFLLFFMFPMTGLGLLFSLLAIVFGIFGLTTKARVRAGLGLVAGVGGGLLSTVPFLVVPM
ncbi:hypothetical protein [Sphingopyxis sp. H115]|uniref:hypothetical protein n=1 Tax=Sphingopyxis sp. H115 TaxID=1759073 RepID=UPI00128F12B4|nr:hypothetical protein [Sphingopyxis sp. H115]